MVDGKPAKRTGEGAEGRNEGVSEDSDDTVFSGIGMGMGNYYPNTAQHSTAPIYPRLCGVLAFSLSRIPQSRLPGIWYWRGAKLLVIDYDRRELGD